MTQQVVEGVLAPFPETNRGVREEDWGIRLNRRCIRFLHVPIVVEVRLPETSSSITGGQRRETVCVHLDGQRADSRAVLLTDALRGRQADDSGSNDCHTHL